MQEITVFDLNNNSIINLVQWDKDVKIYVKEDEIDKAYNVHFFNKNHEGTAMVVESTYQDGTLSTVVPNDLLTESYPITGYIYVEKNHEHKSIYGFRIIIVKRPKPANYIYSDQKEYITFEKVLEEAKKYADNAQSSADDAKQSEENANVSKEAANQSENMATQKAEESKISAEQALQSELNASKSELNALESAGDSEKYALESKSFAKGTGGIIRPNDDSDCAEYFYKQIIQISQGIKGIIPMGSITFAELDLSKNQHEGFMFDISEPFVSDERFKNGSGIPYGAGNNVIYTAEGKWDVLASSDVSGVKGDKETSYRQGFVNITPENVGAVATDGDISNTNVTFVESENLENIESGENANIIFGKIKKLFSDLKDTAFIALDDLIKLFLIKAHPIGSIYLSVNNINPSGLFGGEWIEWGSGRVPVGVNASDGDFNASEKSGGSKYLQSHTHTLNGHVHSLNGHTHSLNGHTHSLNNHNHSFSWSGSHNHDAPSGKYYLFSPDTAQADECTNLGGTGTLQWVPRSFKTGWVKQSSSTSRTISVSGSTGGSSGNTGGSSGDTGGSSSNTAGNSDNTSDHSRTKGSSENLQPYITCYMWKRVA